VVITPLVNWIWTGFGILVLGTGIALLPERAFAFALGRRAGRGQHDIGRQESENGAEDDRQATTGGGGCPAAPACGARGGHREGGLRPWHLLLVATTIAVAAGVFATQGTSAVNAVAVGAAIVTVAWAAAMAARTVSPLVTPELGEQTEMVGGRTRAALEREKMLVLRSIKEVEFDRAMGRSPRPTSTRWREGCARAPRGCCASSMPRARATGR